MNGDMPTIVDAGHAHTIYGLSNLASPLSISAGTGLATQFLASNQLLGAAHQTASLHKRRQEVDPVVQAIVKETKKENPVSRRLVQVFIADPDENVPLEQSMLYSGEQKLTDATDQELFFEIDMKLILEKHNAARVTFINKKVKERVEYLEPVKIRDLRMVVVSVATF